ncbi:unnamed protein product [marine sediment metagenome]|uniref:Uncharacterized protein n=1 Tax=marine sediment metagenome TaxID=412755 RepID=X1HXS7_9ZZZZ
MFSWKPIYKELFEPILQYRNRQDELIRILKDVERLSITDDQSWQS